MIMGAWGLGRKKDPTAKDYVQDGLIAMWDGIENAGWGVHDDSTITWKNLVGTSDFIGQSQTVKNYWQPDGFQFAKNSNTVFIESGDAAAHLVSGGTLEVVYENTNSSHTAPYAGWLLSNRGNNDNSETWFSFSGYWWYALYMPEVNINNRQNGSFAVVNLPSSSSYYGRHTFATTYTSTGACVGYMDGTSTTSNPSNPNVMAGFINRNGRKIYLGKDGPRMNDYGKGKICCIRFYSRPLIADEVAANHVIDKERFSLP